MNLKCKVLLFVVGGIAALNGLLYLATDAVVMSGFLKQESNDADRAVRSTREIIGTMIEESLARMTDWAEWDATAHLVEGDCPTYADENIEAGGLAALRWDVVYVAKPPKGGDSLLVGLDLARENLTEVDPAMLAHLRNPATHFRSGSPTTGFLTVGEQLWITVSRDVTFTDKHATKEPGRFMTCTRVNEAWLARLRKFTGLDITFRRAEQTVADDSERLARTTLAGGLDGVTTLAVDGERTSSFCWMADLYGKPAFLVRVDRDRPLLAQGESILRSSMLVIAVAGLLLLGLTLFGVSRVLRRLDGLMRGVESLRAGAAVPVAVPVADEIGVLTIAFNEMSAKIIDRERTLSAMNERIKLVLDSTGDGLISCDSAGVVIGGVSKAAEVWFGSDSGKKIWDYLFADDEVRRAEFELGWQQLQEGFLPFELLVDQMPRRLRRGERELTIDFRKVDHGDEAIGYLLIVRDITADLDRERAERDARELQNIVANLLRDPMDFERFLAEMHKLVAWQLQEVDESCRKRNLHTLKGNAAVYGFTAYSEYCHKVENALAEGESFDGFAPGLLSEWDAAVQRIRQFLPEHRQTSIWLAPKELAQFVSQLRNGTDIETLARFAESWVCPPVAAVFARLARQGARLAAALGKQVVTECVDGDLRFDPKAMAPFWDAVIHVVRNAVDHGLETSEARLAVGKPAAGTLRLRAEVDGGQFVITIEDDGHGVAWRAVAESAKHRGLPHDSHEDLVAALFADGLSTRDSVSELSGRGVGLAAVREACEQLDGSIDVCSVHGRGTAFTFRFPVRLCLDAQRALEVGVAP
jgi:sensor domain CHASE-containing protein/HPt (histidine-containing phosphotransfer) domain-containing protein/two-component sensor histidine kinase